MEQSLQERIDQDRQARLQRVDAEIKRVLEECQCTLVPVIEIRGTDTIARIEIVAN